MQIDPITLELLLAVASPFLLALSGVLAWRYQHERERREEVERQLSEHKYKAYTFLLDIFFDIVKASTRESKVQPVNRKMIDRMMDAGKDLIVYGSDDVVTEYQQWLDATRKGEPAYKVFGHFGDLIIAVRRDMGNSKTKVTKENVLRQILTDYDELQSHESS